MHFSRKTILVVGAALLAACGDKVSVTSYTPPTTTAKVNSVEVAPASATLSVGQSITLTAAVNADAGVATTVTWTSSDATKATVSSAGVVAAVAATPGVAICATSTVDTGKKGCASIVVSAATQTIPASVSIASITAGNINTPVNPAAVAGQIDVRLNVNPGNQTISKIVLVVGGVRADSQTFSAAQAAALRFAADEAIAAQTTFPQVLFSINTAKFNATTGVPAWLNAAQQVSAQVYTGTGTSAAATATAQTTLTFANPDGFVATVVTSGTTANALNATGYRYDRGGLDVTILPVIYSGRAIASATLAFGSALCDANGTGTRTTALTAPAAGSTAWTKIGWAQTTPTGGLIGNYLTNYEFNGCAGSNNTGETVSVTAVDANGDAILAAGTTPLNANAANSLRLDNRAPNGGSPVFIGNPNGRQNGWINAAVSMVGLRTTYSATSNSWLYNATPTDAGQGSYVPFLRIAASATGLVDEARAATASSAPTLAAPSLGPTTYCAIATAQDALGNETARPAAGSVCTAPFVGSATGGGATSTGLAAAPNSMLFGVDIAPPTITLLGRTDDANAFDANERLNNGGPIGATNYFAVNVSDTGSVGNSGMLSGSAVMGTVIIRNAANALLTNNAVGAANSYCAVGAYGTDGVTCGVASVQAAPVFPKVVTGAGVTANSTAGYYTFTAYSRDAAGNQSGTVSRVAAYDLTANVPALTTALFNTPLTGGSVTFNANASDNFDLRDVTYNLTYPTLAGPIVYPAVTLGTFNGTQVYSNIAAGITIPAFIRQVEQLTGNAPIAAAGGAQKPTALTGVARDQANVSSAAAVTAIPGASVTTGVSYLAAAAPSLVRSFAISNAATNVSNGATSPAANSLSVTLNIDVTGPTATFNSPFISMGLYRLVGGNLVQIGSTSSYTTTDDGSAFGRQHRYQITWTPGTGVAAGATALYAVGVNAAGDALVTPVSAAITITNP